MALPSIFTPISSGSIASYDYLDYAAGVGYKTYYPCGTELSGSFGTLLSPSQLSGTLDYRSISVTSGTTELNFDLTFNNPAMINGECFISYTLSLNTNSGGYVTYKIFHVRAGVETQIGTCVTATETTAGTAGYRKELINATLTQTSFSIGDILRLSCEVTRTAGTYSFWFDPSGRQTLTESGSGATIDTSLKFIVPFKIDL